MPIRGSRYRPKALRSCFASCQTESHGFNVGTSKKRRFRASDETSRFKSKSANLHGFHFEGFGATGARHRLTIRETQKKKMTGRPPKPTEHQIAAGDPRKHGVHKLEQKLEKK